MNKKNIIREITFNLGIILAFTKRKPVEISQAIRNHQLESVSSEFIQHLIQYLPDETEVKFRRKEKMSHPLRLFYHKN